MLAVTDDVWHHKLHPEFSRFIQHKTHPFIFGNRGSCFRYKIIFHDSKSTVSKAKILLKLHNGSSNSDDSVNQGKRSIYQYLPKTSLFSHKISNSEVLSQNLASLKPGTRSYRSRPRNYATEFGNFTSLIEFTIGIHRIFL